MILVDTSVWVDHLRRGEAGLARLLEDATVLMHPFVVGELACGNLAGRAAVLELLQDLPLAVLAENEEVLRFIEHRSLHGKGLGYVDTHLLVSTALSPDARIWTRDKRLKAAADSLGYAHAE